jgi:hypothetical protein
LKDETASPLNKNSESDHQLFSLGANLQRYFSFDQNVNHVRASDVQNMAHIEFIEIRVLFSMGNSV